MKTRLQIIALLLFICLSAYSQTKHYNYKREINGVKEQWHKIVLPNDIFGKISTDFSDIRILGITPNNDTIEAPYFIEVSDEKISQKDIAYNLLNESKNENGYFFTFEIPTKVPINRIELNFDEQNFDWKIALEGGQNQQEWFTIIEDYRILSISNNLINFHFTKLTFPNSKYRYYRVLIKNKIKPELTSAVISLDAFTNGNYNDFAISNTKTQKQNKETVIDFNLKELVPICYLNIRIKNGFDYYRPITIQYLTDSVKTEQGWKYHYRTLETGIVNSFEKNEFIFASTILKKLRITIDNQDNKPLEIDSIIVKGYKHELIAHFSEAAKYYLAYGNKNVFAPSYDITRFTDKIPKSLISLKLGEEQPIIKDAKQVVKPLFQNKLWLWVIMSLIIALLGWFSFRMIKQK